MFVTQLTTAQNFQTVEEVNNACSSLGFSGNEEAEIIVDEILDKIGVFRNFVLQECPNINNAVAKNILNNSGLKERYILYDADFFKRIDNKASNEWASISILAHEIAHHLNGHALNDTGSNHKFELEADYSGGFYLGKMNATLDEAQSAIKTLRYTKATSTHPAKADRLAAIEKGWLKAVGKNKVKTIVEENDINAYDLYRKGEVAFLNHNYKEAFNYFNKSKDLGNVDAYFYLSSLYFWEFFGEKDSKEKAYEYAVNGYELGSVPATYQLGLLLGTRGYDDYKINDKDFNNILHKNFQINWFENQYEKYKTPFIATIIGKMYQRGNGGVNKDSRTALYWYKKSAEQNDVMGQYNLALMYEEGLGITKDYKRAIQWYTKGAENGDAVSQNSLGVMYANAIGTKRDRKKAVYWFLKAAAQEYSVSQYYLGLMNFHGFGLKRDHKKAVYWFKLAANQGDSDSQFYLGGLYASGKGVEEDQNESIYWFREAAKQDHKKAQEFLKDLGETW